MVDHENRETDMHENAAAEEAIVHDATGGDAVAQGASAEGAIVHDATGGDGDAVTEGAIAEGATVHDAAPGAEEEAVAAADVHADAGNGKATEGEVTAVPVDVQAEEHQPDEVHALEEAGDHPSELQDSTEPAGEVETEVQGAEREQQLAENLQRKEALLARAEELKESTEWKATAEAIKRLQAEWKAIGPVAKERSQELWDRFRAPANLFFERRQEHQAKLR